VALAAVAAFGFLSAREGNRLNVLIAGSDRLVALPARTGKAGLVAALSTIYDSHRRDRGPDGDSDLTAALIRTERTQRRRGQIVVISDFLDRSDWALPLRRLGLRHQVIAAHITDPRELRLPAVGILSVVDTESGQLLHVQTNSAALRKRYETAAAARHERIHRTAARAGAEYVHLSTDRDWLLDVVRFVGQRRYLRPGRRR
jgi:uncharacterized protein (DUF58 family)